MTLQAMPWIIAHRGASHAAPENTLAAIALGWQEQADGAEIDIHLTADGQIVAIHDGTLGRTAGLQAAVADTPLAVIQTLDAGRWKSPAYVGEPVPTLSAILGAIPPGRKLLIEIKGRSPAMPDTLADTLKQGPMPMQDIVLIDFTAEQLAQAHARLPDTTALLLAGRDERRDADDELGALIRLAQQAGFHGLNLSHAWPWDVAMVQRLHDAGLTCWVWTVNDEAHALHLARCGVDGLTSDRPGAIRAHLAAAGCRPGRA